MIRAGLLGAMIFLCPALLSAQIAPSATQIAQYEGLHKSAHFGDLDELQRQISQGDDLESRDSAGRTPVHVAAFASHEFALAMLAAAGADMNALESQDYDAVTIAAVANDVDMLEVALAAGNKGDQITSPYEGTALIAAAHLGHAKVVRMLLDAGAPPDHINNLGWTALIEAVILGDGGPDHIATVRALLDGYADISIGDRDGITALEHAKSRGYSDIEAILGLGP